MTTRERPIDCCGTPIEAAPMGTDERTTLIAQFKALSDPTRFDIFRLVAAQNEPICACDIGDRFPVSQPTISHHMKMLVLAGLVVASKRGIWTYYQVDPAAVRRLSSFIEMAIGSDAVMST